MSTQRLAIAYEGPVFSPFTGLPAETDDGPNEQDPSLLFVHYGNASEYGYVSQRLRDAIGSDAQDNDPDKLAERLTLPGAVVFEVDTGWNGVNHYGFAP